MMMIIIEVRVGIEEKIIKIVMAPTGLEPVLMMSLILAPIPVQMMRKEEEEEEEEDLINSINRYNQMICKKVNF